MVVYEDYVMLNRQLTDLLCVAKSLKNDVEVSLDNGFIPYTIRGLVLNHLDRFERVHDRIKNERFYY